MAKKKKWVKMQITRVELNPEQAVLACCDYGSKNSYGFGPYACDNSPANCAPPGGSVNYTNS